MDISCFPGTSGASEVLNSHPWRLRLPPSPVNKAGGGVSMLLIHSSEVIGPESWALGVRGVHNFSILRSSAEISTGVPISASCDDSFLR